MRRPITYAPAAAKVSAYEPGGFGAVEPVVHVGLARAGVEAVERDRHLCSDECHVSWSFPFWMRLAQTGENGAEIVEQAP